MTIFSTDEFDELRGAFYRCNLKEAVQPRSDSGKIIDDADTYNRVQVLLNTPDMEEAHGFLYDIDFDHLNDGVVSKVNDLYELAVDKGFIEDERVKPIETEPKFSDDPLKNDGNPDEPEEKAPFMSSGLDSAYTCLYTAMKDGQLKSGECFSNAKDTQSAKADAISKLANLGFTSIEIIAVEQGDTSARGTPDVSNVSNVTAPNYWSDENEDDETDNNDEVITEADETAEEEQSETEEAVEEPAEEDESPESDDPLLSAAGEEETDETEEETEETSSDETETEEEESTEEETTTSDEETSTEDEDSSEEEATSTEEEKSTEEEEETEETSTEEDSEKEENEVENEKLSKAEILELVEKYVKVWKQILKNMEIPSYKELDIKGRAKFYDKLSEKWTEKHDPREFMSPKNVEQIEALKITL